MGGGGGGGLPVLLLTTCQQGAQSMVSAAANGNAMSIRYVVFHRQVDQAIPPQGVDRTYCLVRLRFIQGVARGGREGV